VVAVSACLLGAPGGFDGRPQRNAWVSAELAAYADLVPLPPAPGSAAHLAGVDGAIVQPGALAGGSGPAALAAAGLPVADAGRLRDAGPRAHFLTRLYAQARWRTRSESLADFHKPHKFLLYAQSPAHYRLAGRAAAQRSGDYAAAFSAALAVEPTPGKRSNVFQHLLGFFRGRLPGGESRALALAVEDYRGGRLPFAAPLALFEHAVERCAIDYLRGQHFFRPYPQALAAGGYV
jgi:uncharacterized protein YbgA (DUF1722 family)